VAVYSVDENLTPVLLLAMHTCFVSFAGLGIGLGLVTAGLNYNAAYLFIYLN